MSERVLVSIPRESVNDETVLILAWKMASGSRVEQDELICEVETSKAVLEIHAPAAGFVVYQCAAGDELPVGATICTIEAAPPPAGSGVSGPELGSPAAPAARLSAAALRTASECGIAPSSFPAGTLVRRQDVLRVAGKPEIAAHGHGDRSRTVPVEWSDLPRRKLLERKILQHGRELTIQSSVTSICRVTQLSEHLTQLLLPGGGIQAAIISEAAHLLNKYSEFNATYDTGRIGRYGQINVGWALDGGHGLVVPVIRDADKKTIQEVASNMERQTEAYLENALSTGDFLGGTFTVTDLSSHGVSFFQPLLAEGQSAILGIGKSPGQQGETLWYFTLVFDHQLSEGKRAAEFLQELGDRLQAYASAGTASPEMRASSNTVRYCALCQRDSRTLQNMKIVLLKSEVPQGFVCSLCVAGW